ncbi:MAG: fructose-6-phosphate aldolase [Flavobacteriales bacterium]|jgi:transaldolase|nr:fructose-6-phosphate aldolase [Flavobacteriales bacterium]
MKIFIDTANLKDIQEAENLGILDGVTTNPSLMAKEGVTDVNTHYQAICNICKGKPVSAEVFSTQWEEMVEEGKALYALNPDQIVVKIPITEEGLKALVKLNELNIPTNCTLVFSVGQALLAAKAGAKFVSPFVGRLDDISQHGMELIHDIKQVFANYGFQTEILAASIRHTNHLLSCAQAGSDVVTAPLKSIKGLLNHPLTDIGLEKFIADSKKIG